MQIYQKFNLYVTSTSNNTKDTYTRMNLHILTTFLQEISMFLCKNMHVFDNLEANKDGFCRDFQVGISDI